MITGRVCREDGKCVGNSGEWNKWLCKTLIGEIGFGWKMLRVNFPYNIGLYLFMYTRITLDNHLSKNFYKMPTFITNPFYFSLADHLVYLWTFWWLIIVISIWLFFVLLWTLGPQYCNVMFLSCSIGFDMQCASDEL